MTSRVQVELLVDPVSHGWIVRIAGRPDRLLSAVQHQGWVLPYPAHGQAGPAGQAARDQALVIAEALIRLNRNDYQGGEAAAIGRYLWSCLAGDSGDAASVLVPGDPAGPLPGDPAGPLPGEPAGAAAGNRRAVELVIATAPDAVDFQRLPWELMHDATGFLAAKSDPMVSISRQIGLDPAAPGPARGPIGVDSTVLVVVGGSLDDPDLRPAAEYLALFDTLRLGPYELKVHLIVEATYEDLETACRVLRPGIVHVIAHGGHRPDGTGFVQFAPDRPGERARQLTAEQMLVALTGGGLPHVLVLTSCRTGAPGPAGTTGAFTFESSMAARCALGGVPVVAAMTGAVASTACRYFTLGFYQALLSGHDVLAAAADGRRVAFVGVADPAAEPDWAYPAIFHRPGFDGRITIADGANLRARAAVVRLLLSGFQAPRAFCGRQLALHRFGQLLVNRHPLAPAILPLVRTGLEGKMGTSRMVAEMAAHAIRAGFVVGYRTPGPAGDYACDFPSLAKSLVSLTRENATELGIELPLPSQVRLLSGPPGAPGLHPILLELLEGQELARSHPKVVGAALRLDMVAMADAVIDGAKGRGVVVFIDDLHHCGQSVELLLAALRPDGLGSVVRRVPVVFSYAQDHDVPAESATRAIRDYVEQRGLADVRVEPFSDSQAPLAYQQFLLGDRMPLVPAPGSHQGVFETIHDQARGRPDQLQGDTVRATIKALLYFKNLLPATDAQRLAELIGDSR